MLITFEVIEMISLIDTIHSSSAIRRMRRQRPKVGDATQHIHHKVPHMQNFTLHTPENAPEQSKPTLTALKEKFGFLPNVMATMAANPVLLNGFAAAFGSFHGGSFDECEKQALLLTNAVTINCPWTVAAHSTFALADGMAEADVKAMRAGKLPSHPKYSALSRVTKALIEKKGNLTEQDMEAFTSAGYSQLQIFEVITGVGVSTMAATTTNLAKTPLNEELAAQAWTSA